MQSNGQKINFETALTVTHAFTGPVPFGGEAELLDQATRVWQQLDRVVVAMLAPVAQMAATSTLAQVGGYRTVKEWAVHAFGIPAHRAAVLETLAMAFHHNRVPATARAFHAGQVSVEEAAAIIKAADKAAHTLETSPTDVIDADGQPVSADRVRQMMETGLLAAREAGQATTVAQISRLAARLQACLLPDQGEDDHAKADAERGARLEVTFGGSFLFQAWGSAADAALLRACLDSYTPPPPPGEADTPGSSGRERRLYEAFTTALGIAHTHHGCAEVETPVVRVQVSVPDTVLAGNTAAGAAVTDTGQVLPLSVLREWLTKATIRPLFVDEDGTVTHVGEERRMASPGMRAAAFNGHTHCAWPTGCDRPLRWCQADHIVEFFQGGPTRADNLQPLCAVHNRIKHRRTVATERKMSSQMRR